MMQDVNLDETLLRYSVERRPEDMATLVEGYLPLCRAVARRFVGQGIEREDLEQVAAMALMEAIERFDPQRGLKLSTLAVPTITGKVRNYLRDRGSLIRQSRDARAQLHRFARVREELTQAYQREPTIREIASGMDVTPEELLSLLDQREATDMMSLNEMMSGDDSRQLEEKLGQQEMGYERVEQREWLHWIFSQVTAHERQLLELRYIEKLGQREVARRLGISQMQVSREERRILTRLREAQQKE